jgi:hypothetical protein
MADKKTAAPAIDPKDLPLLWRLGDTNAGRAGGEMLASTVTGVGKRVVGNLAENFRGGFDPTTIPLPIAELFGINPHVLRDSTEEASQAVRQAASWAFRDVKDQGRLDAAQAAKKAPAAAAMVQGQGQAAAPVAADALFQQWKQATLAQESSNGQNLVGAPTRWGRALGIGQVLPENAQKMAKQLGLPWQPELMTSKTPEGRQYQMAITDRMMTQTWQQAGGDPANASRLYFGGPNPAMHGPKTRQYVEEMMGRMAGGRNGGNAGLGAGELQNPFDPRYGQAAMQLVDQGAGAAMRPETIMSPAMPDLPAPPMPAVAPPMDYSKVNKDLEALKPVMMAAREQNALVRNSWLSGIGQALASLPEGAGIGKILATVGGAALAGRSAGMDKVRLEQDAFDEKMARYNVALAQQDAIQAKQTHEELQHVTELMNTNAREKWQIETSKLLRDNTTSMAGDAVITSRTGKDGQLVVTRTPFRGPIMAQAALSKAQIMQGQGQQAQQGQALVAQANNAFVLQAAAAAASSGHADGQEALLQAPAFVAGSIVDSGMVADVVGGDWPEFQKQAREYAQSISPNIASGEYTDAVQQWMKSELYKRSILEASNANSPFNKRFFSYGQGANQLWQADRARGGRTTTRTGPRGTTVSEVIGGGQ